MKISKQIAFIRSEFSIEANAMFYVIRIAHFVYSLGTIRRSNACKIDTHRKKNTIFGQSEVCAEKRHYIVRIKRSVL